MLDRGFKVFLVVWFGQLVSLTGTAMTRFALLIWAYQQTGSAATVALLGFFSTVPFILVSPVAGVWVDRLDRRRVMLWADVGAGVMTSSMLLLFATGNLTIWHIYVAAALSGAFEAFQSPAYSASISILIPKEQYARANGLRSMAESGAQVVAPFIAGLVLVWIGIAGVMTIDVITFLVAMVTLALVRLPRVQSQEAKDEGTRPGQFRRELQMGFRYIARRPGLLGLMLIFTGINFLAALTYYAILPAMILARSGNSEWTLATVQGALGAAGVVGGLIVGVWGGPRRKIHGALGFAALSFLLGDFLFAVGQDVGVWLVAACATSVFIPIIISSNHAIWQAKVAPALQGRVFSVNSMLRLAMMPLGYLLGGLMADRWLEPAMASGGALAAVFGPLVGTGPGAGMAVMFVGTAVLGCLMSLVGYLIPAVRCVEQDLPDHDSVAASRVVVPSS